MSEVKIGNKTQDEKTKTKSKLCTYHELITLTVFSPRLDRIYFIELNVFSIFGKLHIIVSKYYMLMQYL